MRKSIKLKGGKKVLGMYDITKIKELGQTLMGTLELDGYPVGVKLVEREKELITENDQEKMRYCQALMRARWGETRYINKDNITCPAAARALGFRELPEGLKSGKGLVGFGITSVDDVGRKMFENMPCLEMNQISHIKVYPLPKAGDVPDVIVIEDEVEKLMWIVLSYLHNRGGGQGNWFNFGVASSMRGFHSHSPPGRKDEL